MLRIQADEINVFADDFEYIEEVKGYSTTRKQHAMLVDQRDFVYQVNNRDDHLGKVYWRCRYMRKLKCKARCVSKGNKIVGFTADHNHAPDDGCWRNILYLQMLISASLNKSKGSYCPREINTCWWIKEILYITNNGGMKPEAKSFGVANIRKRKNAELDVLLRTIRFWVLREITIMLLMSADEIYCICRY